jgi:hypothetical protein
MMLLPGLMAVLVGLGAIVALWAERPLRATGGTLTAVIGMSGLLATTPSLDPLIAGLWLLLAGGVVGSVAWANASIIQRAEEERGRRRTRWYKAALVLPLVGWANLLATAWWFTPTERLLVSPTPADPHVLWPLVPALVIASLVPLWWARVHAPRMETS